MAEKANKMLTCQCGAAAKDNSKERNRFVRRHALKGDEEMKKAHLADVSANRAKRKAIA